MSNNPAQGIAVLIIGLMVIGAILLAILGFDPTIAVDIALPFFVLAVFAALGVGFFRAATS